MKKLSYLFAVAASAACLCACTDVTDALPAEQIPADARSTLGADVVLQWNNEEQTIDGFGVAQAGWSDYLYAHRKRQGDHGCDVRTGRASPQYPQGRGIPPLR